MTLADLFLAELDRREQVAPSVDMLGKELARLYKQQAETLAGITAMYVKTFYELDDLKKQRAAP